MVFRVQLYFPRGPHMLLPFFRFEKGEKPASSAADRNKITMNLWEYDETVKYFITVGVISILLSFLQDKEERKKLKV